LRPPSGISSLRFVSTRRSGGLDRPGLRRRLTDRALSRVRRADQLARDWPKPASSPAPLFEAERALGFWGKDSTPTFGVALSGGGNRSAAFSMGVLQALHETRAAE
jgi:hypothetical protein